MNKLILLFLLLFSARAATAQFVYPYQDIKLEKPSDYGETEPLALSAANFLLSTPFVELDKQRSGALQFLSNWMAGNKDFSFYRQGVIQDIAGEANLLSMYIAAVAKYSLENKATAVNPLKIEAEASRIVLAYSDNPVNNFKIKKKLRKLLEKN